MNPFASSDRLTFAQFMEYCLYDPQEGYYKRKERIFGPAGDYYTSSYTHPAFGWLLAERLVSYWRELKQPEPFDVVELGPGEGLLGKVILEYLQSRHPRVHGIIRYHPVEEQDEIPSRIEGVVFSNEFFDALPFHRVVIRRDVPREIFVMLREGELCEVEDAVSDPRIAQYLHAGFKRLREAYEYEVNLRMLEVMERLANAMSRGILLTIDYGYEWEEYDTFPRASGTWMCYFKHQAHANPYLHIGRQDITAHVNFEIMRWQGDLFGWVSAPLKTQRQFLCECGLEQILIEEEKQGWLEPQRMEERLQLKELLFPGGISDVMKVLEQRKL
ncbi:MAG: SAM-dependent methyltransferase [Acidobacteria bacterium]|nr:SAM-dependent methyltransferase [Acidobacteriota bacterium]